MQVESFSESGVASTLDADGAALSVRNRVSAGGRNVFRRAYGLRLRTDGIADGIRIDAASAHLDVEFTSLQTDAIGGADPLATAKEDGNALVVTLRTAMQIRSVRLRDISTSSSIGIHRMDGDALADDPSREPKNNGTIGDDLVDVRFGVRAGDADLSVSDLLDVDVTGRPTGARLGLAPLPANGAPLQPAFFWTLPGVVDNGPDSPSGDADVGLLFGDALQRHIDALPLPYPENIDLLLLAESDAPCRLRFEQFDVDFVLLRTRFRSVLLREGDVRDAPAFLARLRTASMPLSAFLAGQLSGSTTAMLAAAAPGAPSQRLLRAVLNDLNHALQAIAFYSPARFAEIALSADTVAAAAAEPVGMARTRLNRRLLDQAFPQEIVPLAEPDAEPAERLSARAAATSTRDVLVDVPRSATVRSARLELVGQLRDSAPGTANGSVPGGQWHGAPPAATGVLIDGGRAVAVRLTPSSAILASGVAAALSVTALATDLVAELREDQNDAPAGRTIAAGAIRASRLDHPEWLLFSFKTPVLVPAHPHWFVLRTRSGSALWLTQPTPGVVRIGEAAEGAWTPRGGFDAVQPLLQLWSNAPIANAQQLEDDARLRVALGSVSVAPELLAGTQRHQADIASALQSFLATASNGQAIVEVPLTVSALGTGNITILPPTIEYDLA